MRRKGAGPMTRDEFRDALTRARRGEVLSDTGASDAVEDALDKVARRIPGAVQEARRAFEESLDPGPIN